MIFDFHTHISPDDDVDKLIEAMDQCGVDKSGASVVVAPGGDSGQAANRQLHQMIATHPDRLVGYAGVLPYATDGPGFLRYCFETYGFRALKLHPSIQQFYPDDRRIFPIIEEAIQLDIPILVHTGAVPIPDTASKYDNPIHIDATFVALRPGLVTGRAAAMSTRRTIRCHALSCCEYLSVGLQLRRFAPSVSER